LGFHGDVVALWQWQCKPGVRSEPDPFSKVSSWKLVSLGVAMAKRSWHASFASLKDAFCESNKLVHAASADTGRSDAANTFRGDDSRRIRVWKWFSKLISFCRTHASRRVGRLRKAKREDFLCCVELGGA
jgi:hypothetical protein